MNCIEMALHTFDTWELIKKNYFTVGVFFCIILAEIAPWIGAQGGPLIPEITVKYFAVFIIFFSSGLTIKWNDLSRAVKQYQLHVFIQAFSFLYIPIFIHSFLFFFEYLFELNTWVYKGLIIVACMPPPVSSAVILIKSMGGNEAAAIFNSALGSVLGLLLTPLLLLFYVGISSPVPVFKTFFQLTQTMIVPVLLGQVSQRVFSQGTLARIPFSVLGQISLLYIIYTSFCDMFIQEGFSIDAHLLLITIFLVVMIQIILLFTIFHITSFVSKKINICTAQDVIAVTFCSTHKSLTLGMPLMKTLYGGYSHLSYISLPLLIYHPVQLILGGIIVPYGRKWVKKHSKLSSHKRP